MPAPRFGGEDRPGDIVDAAGRWLAGELGWRWLKSRRDLEIRHASRVLRLHLQGSKWNHTGVATWVSTRVVVLDEDLTRWRQAQPDSTVFPSRAIPVWPTVYNSLLINVERDLDTIECSGLPQGFPSPRALDLDEFSARFRARVLPVLDLFQSPHLVAHDLPDSWLRMVDCGTIEWALAREDRRAATLLLRRYLERVPRSGPLLERFHQAWEQAPSREGLRQPLQLGTQSLGWLARVHDLLDPATLAKLQADPLASQSPVQRGSAAEPP